MYTLEPTVCVRTKHIAYLNIYVCTYIHTSTCIIIHVQCHAHADLNNELLTKRGPSTHIRSYRYRADSQSGACSVTWRLSVEYSHNCTRLHAHTETTLCSWCSTYKHVYMYMYMNVHVQEE